MRYDSEEYMNYVVELDNRVEQREHIFVYKGYVDQEVSKFFANHVKDRLDAENMEYLLSNRIYHIMVECFQNIIRHSADHEEDNGVINPIRGYMSVGKSRIEDRLLYVVTTGNSLNKEKVKDLTNWLNKINSLNEEDLKKLYKTILRENKLNNRGGAGLGFVDMKKRTKNKIDYNLAPMENGNYFLVLSVKIEAD